MLHVHCASACVFDTSVHLKT